MATLYNHYQTLGVSVGAGFADITASYKRLCRKFHPDINNDPASEELMKNINIAYTIIREKFKRETALRDRQAYSRPIRTRRYSNPDMRAQNTDSAGTDADSDAQAESKAFSAMHGYFKAISSCDYPGAYKFLSSYDKKHITQECFIAWRKSVARLYPMREFKITGGQPPAAIRVSGDKTLHARRFSVAVTEDDFTDDSTYNGIIEKLAIYDNGSWKVFLGYESVSDLTRKFDDRFDAKRRKDVAKRWEEHCEGFFPEYDMYSIKGMRKAARREIYRQRRFGGSMTLAAISVTAGGIKKNGQDELLRCAAKAICAALRETDIPAYAGDGVFVILLVELQKKNAEDIINRLISKIRRKAGPQLGGRAIIEHTFSTWSGADPANIDAMNRELAKFSKIM